MKEAMKQRKSENTQTADTNDNVYLILSAKVGRPNEQAHILYDGHEHALLYHHDNQIIILDFLPKENND